MKEINFKDLMQKAIDLAKAYDGQTAPNPPVGAIILDEEGNILSCGVHRRAGAEHAEVQAIQNLPAGSKPYALVVSLEPCNHYGLTSPCSKAILEAGIQKVILGVRDPNPHVSGGGMEYLQAHGIEVELGCLQRECIELIEGFWLRSFLKRPMIILKSAYDESGSMIPPPGTKTFTSTDSLRLAHQLRKSCDAILTGSGTVVSDDPLFTVRYVEDHPGKIRDLIVMDRRARVSKAWITRQEGLGFRVIRMNSLEDLVDYLELSSHLKVLVEAGPQLLASILDSGLWDLHYKIFKGNPDRIEKVYREDSSKLLFGSLKI